MGTGDWNDGMNRVGIDGQGRKRLAGLVPVCDALTRFAAICEPRGGRASCAAAIGERAHGSSQALEQTRLGRRLVSARLLRRRHARWARHEPMNARSTRSPSPGRCCPAPATCSGATQAMEAVLERLVRPDDGLILLFTPPFDKTPRDPGYIKGYLPGIRENGGQYTHAAIWTVWAFAELGHGDTAEELFRLLNPDLPRRYAANVANYKVEPT